LKLSRIYSLKFIINTCGTNDHFTIVSFEIWTMLFEVKESNFYHIADTT